jgi:DNA-binding Lrp family transcriptional regulator
VRESYPAQVSWDAHPGSVRRMIVAIVLMQVQTDRIPETAQAVAELPGVAEVYSVTGEWELVAILRVRAHDDIAPLVTERIAKTAGILATETMIAFRAYAKRDLEQMWGVGLEGSEGV